MNILKPNFFSFLFFISAIVNGQTSIDLKDFGNHTDMLIGQTVIYKPESQYSRINFMVDKVKRKFFNGKKKGTDYSFKKDYSKIVGKQLKIVSIEDLGSTGYDMLGNNLLFGVQNPDLGLLYFETYSKSSSDEIQLFTPLKLPPYNEIFCQEFILQNDKFEGTETVRTGYTENITFSKVKYLKTDETVFYIRLEVGGYTPQALKKGVKIIFDDGELFDYPDVDIDYSVSSSEYRDYDVSAFFRMDDKLINKVLSNRITDFRLYVDDGGRSEEGGKITMEKFKCLVDNTYSVKMKF